ncbi:hypothetical protein ACLI09_03040 [Flavobacterium sp. RHBU_24]|uniref:hypothetical protein n=1 Tax=Flavobacterium sp. RHBU_24 TaxID=3391185 RepID=UPI003985119A
MKRFIAITAGCILLGLFALTIRAMVAVTVTVPFMKNAGRTVQKYCGLGVLFNRESTVTGYATTYRLYQNGQWQRWQQLQQPSYDKYAQNGNYAALKHSRLDINLSRYFYNTAKDKTVEEVKGTKAYKEFAGHLLYCHSNGTRPDSLEVSYYQLHNAPDSLGLLLTFKAGL